MNLTFTAKASLNGLRLKDSKNEASKTFWVYENWMVNKAN